MIQIKVFVYRCIEILAEYFFQFNAILHILQCHLEQGVVSSRARC